MRDVSQQVEAEAEAIVDTPGWDADYEVTISSRRFNGSYLRAQMLRSRARWCSRFITNQLQLEQTRANYAQSTYQRFLCKRERR